MQAIITKYIGPSASRCARITATIHSNFTNTKRSITIPYDDADSARNNHATAAMALVRLVISRDVPNNWECGELPDGRYVFVMQGEEFTRHFKQADSINARVKLSAA